MTDKINKSIDEEYQFPQDEYVSTENTSPEYDAASPAASAVEGSASAEKVTSQDGGGENSVSLLQRFPILQNRRLLMVLGIVVVAIIGFKFLTPSPEKMSLAPESTKVATPSDQALLQQRQQDDAVMNKLNHLSKGASASQAVVSQLRNEVQQLKGSLDRANTNDKAVKQAILLLAQQVDRLSEQLHQAVTPDHTKKLLPSPKLVFHLRAIVPGRAWLVGSNDSTDSVVVGSKVKGYGVVKTIDVNAGKVLTSSGKVITYNKDGN